MERLSIQNIIKKIDAEKCFHGVASDYSFTKTFRLLHNQYDLESESAFYVTVRAHRGGSFTKDYLYLTGLKKVYN